MEDVWEDQGSQRENGVGLEDLVLQDTLLWLFRDNSLVRHLKIVTMNNN
jgi:hypothetical protein